MILCKIPFRFGTSWYNLFFITLHLGEEWCNMYSQSRSSKPSASITCTQCSLGYTCSNARSTPRAQIFDPCQLMTIYVWASKNISSSTLFRQQGRFVHIRLKLNFLPLNPFKIRHILGREKCIKISCWAMPGTQDFGFSLITLMTSKLFDFLKGNPGYKNKLILIDSHWLVKTNVVSFIFIEKLGNTYLPGQFWPCLAFVQCRQTWPLVLISALMNQISGLSIVVIWNCVVKG